MTQRQYAAGRSTFGAVFINDTSYRKENVSGVYINETGAIKVGTVLTVNNGLWSGVPIVYSYQWYRNTSAISGATSYTYTTQSDDIGNTIFCSITATINSVSNAIQNTASLGPVTS